MSDFNQVPLRVVLIGPFPEPAGGVSIHLSRLASGLVERGLSVERIDESPLKKPHLFNLRSLNPFGYFRRLFAAKVAHIQSGVTLFRCLHIVCCRLFRTKVVVTVHTLRVGPLEAKINRLFLAAAHEIILVNEATNRVLQLRDFRVLPAFLPPTSSECRPLPDTVKSFVNRARSENRKLLCANAYKLVLHNDQDLYGLDMCIDLMRQLTRKENYPVAFVFVVATSAEDNTLYDRAVEQISSANLENCFLLHNGTLDFVTLIQECDIVVRPTTTDADALTIREALWFKKPVIASDVVNRPPGTIVFQNRNAASLLSAVISVLQEHHDSPVNKELSDFLSPYMESYLTTVG